MMLEAKFTKEEVKKAVFESYSDGEPGPDGLSFMFYQSFWDVIKRDILEVFEDFHKGELDIYRLNFALITIIPKENEARTMNKFRPISLLNCSYKIFTKVLTSRIGGVIDRLISSNQTTFIKGRFILESVVTAHETLHSVYHGKEKGFVLKLDYEKAYDKVNWQFLLEVLRKSGFADKWVEWIRSFLIRGSVGLTINNEEGEFFHTRKELREGDPLSPLLFNLMVDVLIKMFKKVVVEKLIRGLGNDLVEGGVISLQYVDGTILFVDNEVEGARNLKWVLTCFELISGMRINYHKSELVPVHIERGEDISCFVEIFRCSVGTLPIKYLGIPLHYSKLRREDLQPLIDKIIKRIAGWRGKLLTQAGRLFLIKTYLASIPICLLSFIKFPRWAIDLINSHMANCFWDDYEGHKNCIWQIDT
jgi:hypothetical protein